MKTTRRQFNFLIEKTNTGFSAYSDEYPIFTTGSNITELYAHVLEASNIFFEDRNLLLSPRNIHLEIDLKQFFTYYRVLNAKFLAKRIGMSETLLSHYVNGHKKPSKRQTERILAGIHEIGKELSEISFIAN
jgi:hypothetical protein